MTIFTSIFQFFSCVIDLSVRVIKISTHRKNLSCGAYLNLRKLRCVDLSIFSKIKQSREQFDRLFDA